MARQQNQTLTAAERQEIRQLQQENRRIQARLTKLAGRQATNQQRTMQRATASPAQPKEARVAIRPMIPEAQLQNKDYLVKQYRRTHPWLTDAEALGDVCVQSFNIALPRVRRQEQAYLAKQQTRAEPTQASRATTAQQPGN